MALANASKANKAATNAAIGKPMQQSMEKVGLKSAGSDGTSKSMSAKGGFVAPADINLAGHSITFGDEKQYEYFVDHPLESFLCCFSPLQCCGKQAEYQKRFFMEFEREGDMLKYTGPSPGNCLKEMCKEQVFVEVGRYKRGAQGQRIGSLKLPCKCCGCGCLQKYQEAYTECMGDDILLMSFRDSYDKEVMTIRKKGAGCNCSCCCQKCCACDKCGCACKGCGMDGCCGTVGISTQMDEIFYVYGPMGEQMQDPKAILRLVWRRGLLFGMPNFQMVRFSIEPRGEVKDDDLLLLIGFAYGMCWQTKHGMGSFPNLLGQLEIPGLGPKDRE